MKLAARFAFIPGNEPEARPGLYVIKHRTTGRCYIGIANNVKKRIGEHSRGSGGAGRLQDAVRAEGPEAFIAIPVFYAISGVKGLAEIEANLIAAYRGVEDGYNTAARGRGAGPYGARFGAIIKAAQNRPEVKARMAAVNAKPEVSARRSAALKASHAEPELRARMSATHTTVGSGARIHTPEAKARSIAARQTRESRAAQALRSLQFHATPEGKAKHLAAVREANASPERNAKIAAKRVGCRWITNGVVNRTTRAAEPPGGWRFGKLHRAKSP